ncbi:MAG: DNA/RNA nuclease SfsA [Bacillota bacterium]
MLEHSYQPRLVEARFATRVNRFVASVLVDGQERFAHLPTSGRLRELLVNGAQVWLRPTPGEDRRTPYSLELVRSCEGELVSINSQLPNRLMERWLEQGRFPAFSHYAEVQREPSLGEGRADLRLVGSDGDCLIEVKSVTLVVGGEARFPDAPTSRGARHLRELAIARSEGRRAAVFFVIQRSDAVSFAPNRATDPNFADELKQAFDSGVEISAITCCVSTEGVLLGNEVPIVLA